ncbi:hypothetical protein SEVIR_2G190800v4 [Setaria viridis]|uniref:non-specific serine/threonine protein kinase n=1 Tax=Setaria viridis TaxID=4556 RepID=A0A4U6W5L4_SETVI|nr:probable LRR receptor-like serine/threonine-protein kinase At1g51810 [Setaria viridis]TKW32797.1 hypothetical protein SEVIR_2G190800v2 [Setaria viridis]
MAFLLLFAAFVLAQADHVVGQPPGFLSIDCGLDPDYSGYTDKFTGVVYVSDGPYVDAGENRVVAVEPKAGAWRTRHRTLRSFPSGVRNCYALPTVAGTKYLLRGEFFYGNYDGRNSSTVEFNLHLGPNSWDTVTANADDDIGVTYEALFVAWASWAPACLVNTGRGTPFVSVLELRPLAASLYPPVAPGRSMSMYNRRNVGANGTFVRYPDDPYDRYWWAYDLSGPQWANLSTTRTIQPDPSFVEPLPVLQTAVTLANNSTTFTYTWPEYRAADSLMLFLHFADFQSTQLREFDIYFNGNRLRQSGKLFSPPYLSGSCVYSPVWYKPVDNKYNITLVGAETSVLPPMLNAFEIYKQISNDNPTTLPEDFDAIMAIKLEYGVKKNWMGDPCSPTKYAWEGVTCINTSDNTTRITSLDLSNSHLRGVISDKFALLTALQNLDLSYNNLSGPIPDSLPSLPSLHVLNVSGNHLSGDFLCKNHAGSLVFRYESDGHICNNTINRSRNRAAIIAISVVVSVLAVVVLLACLIWREKRKPNVSTQGPAKEPQPEKAQGNGESQGDYLQNTENRQFMYKELEKFTNNFKHFIGQGGFGPVYYGRLENGKEVAVKMRSESSSHGLDEFFAEVRSLTMVHHRNLVSLVGYCWESDHLALVYDYMPQGNLCDHLRGKNGVAEIMNWGTRVRIALEAAQGLDYLHKGCNLPIIHRDVKSSNILLGQNLQAKIADFGLCKTYLSDSQTHISATAAGTAGYIDPEYYQTGRLTESSDVYSFGVVLLEVATGEPPIVPGHGHIVQRVKQLIATGDVSLIADGRLGGAYDVSSMWKVVDIAMMCVVDAAAQRPTMATVVAQLKESLALEEAREREYSSNNRASPGSDIASLVSTFGPVAR